MTNLKTALATLGFFLALLAKANAQPIPANPYDGFDLASFDVTEENGETFSIVYFIEANEESTVLYIDPDLGESTENALTPSGREIRFRAEDRDYIRASGLLGRSVEIHSDAFGREYAVPEYVLRVHSDGTRVELDKDGTARRYGRPNPDYVIGAIL